MLEGFYFDGDAGAALRGLAPGNSPHLGPKNDAQQPPLSLFTSASVSLSHHVDSLAPRANATDLDPLAAVFVPSSVAPASTMAFTPLFGHADSLPASPLLAKPAVSNQLHQVSGATASPHNFVDALPFDLSLNSTSAGLGLVLSSKPVDEPAFDVTAAMVHMTNPVVMDRKLESPLGLEDSPLSDFLASPMFNDNDGAVPDLVFSSLFPGTSAASPQVFAAERAPTAAHVQAPAISSQAFSALMASVPPTPFVSPAFLTVESPAPAPSQSTAGSPQVQAKKSSPTGFRGSDASLVPIDAPIQPRQYVLPSVTSRKRKTVAVERALAKRSRSVKPADAAVVSATDETALQDDIPADLAAAVERKRLQNTLSARKSRARKQERMAELEAENAVLKTRIAELEAALASR
ncbi:hypothetical protein OIV83_001969 [Microbotryomycetes sp. JL201]|nr:hypothetical protein OIV83_001969 [Microbotryomycetes sp. JL201]